MKYEVTFSCGHTGTVQLYGKGDERERTVMATVKKPTQPKMQSLLGYK